MIVEKVFNAEDQLWFAECSGDYNPIHVDVEWAARHFPGTRVVHGAHILLWSLDWLLQTRPLSVCSIHSTWVKPVALGDVLRLECDPDGTLLRVFLGRDPVMVARLCHGDVLTSQEGYEAVDNTLAAPILRELEVIEECSGVVALPSGVAHLSDKFPALSAAFGTKVLAGIASLSTLVGMHCPGLYSMLSEIDITISPSSQQPVLQYEVSRWMPQFSRLLMQVRGLGLVGQVQAFAGQSERPVPNDVVRIAVGCDAFSGANRSRKPTLTRRLIFLKFYKCPRTSFRFATLMAPLATQRWIFCAHAIASSA